jgi:hypothetical protein
MENTHIIIAFTFFLLFWSIMIYNYIDTLTKTGNIRDMCPDFYNKFNLNNLNVFSPSEKVGGAFYSGGGTAGGGGNSGAGGIIEAIDGIWNWLTSAWDLLQGALVYLGSFVGLMTNIILIMTSNCPSIQWINTIFLLVFIPMFVGLTYILIRLIKSLIPTIGGD